MPKISEIKILKLHMDGWLYNIVFGTQSGERGDVDNGLVALNGKDSRSYQGIRPENIFNMDETGLFFKYMLGGFFL